MVYSSIKKCKQKALLENDHMEGDRNTGHHLVITLDLGDGTQSVQIGRGAETVSKSVLYFLHEKMWYRLAFGLDKYRSNKVS